MSATRNRVMDNTGRVNALLVLAVAAAFAAFLVAGAVLVDSTLGNTRIDLPLIHERASDEDGGDSSDDQDELDENEVSDSRRGSDESEPDENEVSDSRRGSDESEPAEGESDEREPAEEESGGREP
jgi:cobalamin biosynthesis protein CobT